MSLSYTTIGGFPLMVAKALDAYGINGEDALARCDIDPQIAKVPDIRVPVEKIGQLLHLAVSETADPAIGLKAGTFIGPTTFHALTMSMWLSPSLKDAFDRVVRYEQLLSDAGRSGMTHWRMPVPRLSKNSVTENSIIIKPMMTSIAVLRVKSLTPRKPKRKLSTI